ncbi:MAG: small subunit ribosomal protein [Patescibacteria group bacterium]|jgi:small subunit ribosomal protein S9|nr:small subunit ribosomal protein [Patescibacteria group bacterium]
MTTAKTKDKYFEAVGRRKTSTARVRITPSAKTSFVINDKSINEYFTVDSLRKVVSDPFDKQETPKNFSVSIKVSGGGINGQADAIRHGITRALVKFDESLRSPMKKLGFLKRDPRSKERRKAGLAQAARKRKQWSKR